MKGQRWHHFSHLKKNNLRIPAQENSRIVKWQGSSDKESYCLFLDIIMRTTINNLHPRPVYQRGLPSRGPVPRRGSLLVLQLCPDTHRICYQPLARKGVLFSKILHFYTTLQSSLPSTKFKKKTKKTQQQRNKLCSFSLTGMISQKCLWLSKLTEYSNRMWPQV